MEWYVYPIIVGLVAIAFRNRIFSILAELYYRYKKNKKHKDALRRLSVDPSYNKFSQKEYLKMIDKQKKAQMKKNREKQEDAK